MGRSPLSVGQGVPPCQQSTWQEVFDTFPLPFLGCLLLLPSREGWEPPPWVWDEEEGMGGVVCVGCSGQVGKGHGQDGGVGGRTVGWEAGWWGNSGQAGGVTPPSPCHSSGTSVASHGFAACGSGTAAE